MKKQYEIVTRLGIKMSCETIEFIYSRIDVQSGEFEDFSRVYKSTPKRVGWVVFASNKYTVYKG